MALHIWYDDPNLGFTEITGYVKWGVGEINLQQKAEQGTVATSSIVVQDPDGIFDFQGLRVVFFIEDEADPERIWTGWIWSKVYERGTYYRTEGSRQVTLELQDINHIFAQKVMAGADTTRPAETDVERMQWLMTTSEALLIGDTTTYLSTVSPVSMDANPNPGYNGQMFQSVVDDCAQESGKNYFILDIFDGYDFTPAIWYGADSLEEFVSEATISNVESEVDGVTVFWGDVSAALVKEPSRLYSGMFANYDGGYRYLSLPATIESFGQRDTIVSWPNVKTQARAEARILSQLARLNTEEEAVTVTIYSMLPSQANIFRAGQRINGVKFTHFPGWEFGRDVRIVTKTLTDQSEQFYSMELELLPLLPSLTCVNVLGGLSMYDSGRILGGPPCAVSPGSPSAYPALVLTMMVMINNGTCIGPPIVGPNLTVSGFTEVQKYQGAPAACEHSLLMVASKALTSGSPGSMSCTFTGNGAEAYRAIGLTLQTSATAPVQVAQQNQGGSTITLSSTPTPGNMLVMFRSVETNNWTATPGVGWTQIGTQVKVNPGGTSEQTLDVWVHCVEAGDGTVWGNGDASFTHWSFLSEWEITQ